MADNTFFLRNFSLKPGHSIEVGGVVPQDCKQFSINLGTDAENYVLHFNPRFDVLEAMRMIILNTRVDGVFGVEQRESFFPFQEGSDTTVTFQFEHDKITIHLPTGNPLSFAARSPIEEISYLGMGGLQPKSITLK